jgi:hypothetical protein
LEGKIVVANVQTIDAAFQACRSGVEGDDEDHIERLELLILNHHPLGPQDAGIVLEAALVDLRHGGRSDGLDVAAVERVIAWIGRQADVATRPSI